MLTGASPGCDCAGDVRWPCASLAVGLLHVPGPHVCLSACIPLRYRDTPEGRHADHHSCLARSRQWGTPRRDHPGDGQEIPRQGAQGAAGARCRPGRGVPRQRLRRGRVCRRPGRARASGRAGLCAAARGCGIRQPARGRRGGRPVASARRDGAPGSAGRAQAHRVRAGIAAAHHPWPGHGRAELAGGGGRLPRHADRGRGGTEILPHADHRGGHHPAVQGAGDRRRRGRLAGDRHGASPGGADRGLRRAPGNPRAGGVAGCEIPRTRGQRGRQRRLCP